MSKPKHPGHGAQTTRNIGLAFRILDEAIADPDALGGIPKDALIVALPYDDTALAMLNLGLANTLAQRGERAWLQRVGVPASERSGWGAAKRHGAVHRPVQPRWAVDPAPDPDDLVIVYDRGDDSLLLDLFGGRRSSESAPVNEHLTLMVSTDTDEVVGHILPRFIARAAEKAPSALDLLLHTNVRLDGITRDEVIDLRNKLVHGAPPIAMARPTMAELTKEFARISA